MDPPRVADSAPPVNATKSREKKRTWGNLKQRDGRALKRELVTPSVCRHYDGMAQARIERNSKFTMMLAEDETKMLSALCNLQGVSAASLIRKLILDEYGRRVLTQRIASEPLNPAFAKPVESKKPKKPKKPKRK